MSLLDWSDFLRESRDDVVVTDGPPATVDGRPAESFRMAMAPRAQPSDLWCPVGGSCFKPLQDKPMQVLVVESSQGPLWLGAEFLPEDEELAWPRSANWWRACRSADSWPCALTLPTKWPYL